MTSFNIFNLLARTEPTIHNKPSPRAGPQDLLVTHYYCDDNQQDILHNFAINQVAQCESDPQAIETTTVFASLQSKTRATTLVGQKSQQHFLKRQYTVYNYQVDGINNIFIRVIMNVYYIPKIILKKLNG